MNSTKYIGMDVHKEATTIAVMNAAGKLVMESIVETKAATIVQFLEGLRGELYVTFEEGTWAAWLYDLLKPYVTKVVVCNPRKNALLKAGNKSDRIDARKLEEDLLSLLDVGSGKDQGSRSIRDLFGDRWSVRVGQDSDEGQDREATDHYENGRVSPPRRNTRCFGGCDDHDRSPSSAFNFLPAFLDSNTSRRRP